MLLSESDRAALSTSVPLVSSLFPTNNHRTTSAVRCASFSPQDREGRRAEGDARRRTTLACKWLIRAGQLQSQGPTGPFRTSQRVIETTEGRSPPGQCQREAMASNSLFSSVTPCQQNFFW
ncbi:hypothetical protein JZ751_010379, partial [Albula glossodonta]